MVFGYFYGRNKGLLVTLCVCACRCVAVMGYSGIWLLYYYFQELCLCNSTQHTHQPLLCLLPKFLVLYHPRSTFLQSPSTKPSSNSYKNGPRVAVQSSSVLVGMVMARGVLRILGDNGGQVQLGARCILEHITEARDALYQELQFHCNSPRTSLRSEPNNAATLKMQHAVNTSTGPPSSLLPPVAPLP